MNIANFIDIQNMNEKSLSLEYFFLYMQRKQLQFPFKLDKKNINKTVCPLFNI